MASQASTDTQCGRIECVNPSDFNDITSPPAAVFFNEAVTYDMGDCPLPDTAWGFTGTAPYWITWSGSSAHTFTGQAGIFSSISSQADANAAAQAALDEYVATAIAAGELECMIWTPVFLTTPPRNWYNIEDLSAQADNSDIDSWPDRGGAAWPAETTGSPPKFRTSVSGYPAAEFPAPGKSLRVNVSAGGAAVTNWSTSISGTDSTGLSGYSSFLVLQTNGVATQVAYVSASLTPLATMMFTGLNNTANKWSVGGCRRDAEFTQTLASATNFTAGSFEMVCGIYTYTSALLRLYLNGSLDSTANPFQTAGITDVNSFGPPGGNTLIGTSSFRGYMREFIVLTYVPTTDERQKIEGYLAWTWGLTASLPVGHPYKNSPPLPP